MKTKRNKLSLLLGLFLLLGVVTSTFVVESPMTDKIVLASCENDECNLTSNCQDAPGTNSGCALNGSECTTYDCKEEGD